MCDTELCCGFYRKNDSLCKNKAIYKTKENVLVCGWHLNLTKEDIEKSKLRILEKEKRIIIEENNKKLMEENKGKIPLRNIEGKIIDFALVSPEDYENTMQYKWSRYITKD